MKILVNTRLLIKNKLDGIGWFTYETMKRITQNHPEHTFYFLFDRPYSDEFIFAQNIKPIVLSPPTRHPLLWYVWFEYRIPKLIKRLKPDIFVSTDGYLSLKSKIPSLAVIHDINFLHFPKDLPLTSRLYYNYFFPRFAKKANRLATVSEFSKKDIVENYNIEASKIDVVYNGYNEVYQPISDDEKKLVKQKYTNGNEFFIFIGSLHPRKNVANMLLAFDKFRDKVGQNTKFVIVGEVFFMTKDIRAALQKMKYSGDVIFSGRLEPIEIKGLLGAARALVLVSKFEGFGIPVIEALRCNTPVIVSNVSSLPEVAQNAGIYVDAFSSDSITRAMMQMAEDEELRGRLVLNGNAVYQQFSWEKTANALWRSILVAGKSDG